jgi:CW-type Zinc Finger
LQTSANRVVVLDQHFNPTVVLQAISRVYRYGQKKPVFVYTMLTQGTMEEKVYGRCVNKTGIALRIVEDKTIERCFTAQELADLADNNMWLTCDECGKSRLLADSTGGKIGDKWYCRMNVSDPVNNNCKASEKTQAWYDDREEDKKESAKYGSPMKRDDKILRHILSVTEEDTTLVCDHFHEILMETATVAEKLEEARQELAASGQVPKPPATTERAILLGGDDENQALAQQCASVMKNASRAGAAPNQANAAMQAMQAFLSVFQSMTNNGASK